MPASGTETARILVVCTGNICRSPYAQFALSAALARGGIDDVVVSSAGTRAVPASGVAPLMAPLLEAEGIDVSGFSTRQLTRELIAEADLVLTAERAHRREVVILEPPALRRTFTLLQFGRLAPAATPLGRHVAEGSTGDRLRNLIQRSAAARATVNRGIETDDVLDPWGGSAEAYRAAAAQMQPAIRSLTNALVPRDIGSII